MSGQNWTVLIVYTYTCRAAESILACYKKHRTFGVLVSRSLKPLNFKALQTSCRPGASTGKRKGVRIYKWWNVWRHRSSRQRKQLCRSLQRCSFFTIQLRIEWIRISLGTRTWIALRRAQIEKGNDHSFAVKSHISRVKFLPSNSEITQDLSRKQQMSIRQCKGEVFEQQIIALGRLI